jgi:hypothetical protein
MKRENISRTTLSKEESYTIMMKGMVDGYSV